MYGNGVRTGMETIVAVHRQIQWDLRLALAAFSAMAAGTATLGAAVCRFVTAVVRVSSVAAVAASASSASLS